MYLKAEVVEKVRCQFIGKNGHFRG